MTPGVRHLAIRINPRARRWLHRRALNVGVPYAFEVINHVNIEPVFGCNQNCPMCFHGDAGGARLRPRFLDQKNLNRILASLSHRRNTVNLYLHGEPLLHPDIDALIRCVRASGRVVHCSTNGLLLTPARALAMRKAGLGTLFVSFDGLRAESYRRLRGKGMAQVKQALEQLAEPSLRARLPRISVRCAKLTESPGEVRALLEWTADLGIVSEVQFQTFWPWPRRKPLEGIERELGTEKLCCQVFGAMNVLTDGTVSPCGFDAKGELAIGNALSSRLDDSIVNGLAALRFRRTHLRGARSEIPVCGDCLLPRWSGGAQTLNVGQYLQMTDVQRDEFARSVAAL